MADNASSSDSWRLQLEDSNRRFYQKLVESEREFYRGLNDLRIAFGMPQVTHSCDSVVNRAYERTLFVKDHNETSAMSEGTRLKPLDESVKKVEVQVQQMQLLMASMSSTRNFATDSDQQSEEQTQSDDVPSSREEIEAPIQGIEGPNQESEYKALPESFTAVANLAFGDSGVKVIDEQEITIPSQEVDEDSEDTEEINGNEANSVSAKVRYKPGSDEGLPGSLKARAEFEFPTEELSQEIDEDPNDFQIQFESSKVIPCPLKAIEMGDFHNFSEEIKKTKVAHQVFDEMPNRGVNMSEFAVQLGNAYLTMDSSDWIFDPGGGGLIRDCRTEGNGAYKTRMEKMICKCESSVAEMVLVRNFGFDFGISCNQSSFLKHDVRNCYLGLVKDIHISMPYDRGKEILFSPFSCFWKVIAANPCIEVATKSIHVFDPGSNCPLLVRVNMLRISSARGKNTILAFDPGGFWIWLKIVKAYKHSAEILSMASELLLLYIDHKGVYCLRPSNLTLTSGVFIFEAKR